MKPLNILLFAIFIGCTEEVPVVKEVEIEVTKSWKQRKEFVNLTKIKMNSHSTGSSLFFHGPEFFSTITSDNEVEHAATLLKYPEFYRLPVSAEYFVEADGSLLRFVKSDRPAHHASSTGVDLKYVAPDFSAIYFGYYYQWQAIDINNRGQCLLPIYSNNANHNLVAYLFDTAVEDHGGISILDTTRIDIPNPSPYPNNVFYCAKAMDDYFLVSVDYGTFKVYPDGSHRKVLDTNLYNVFKHQGKLYGFKQFNQLFISEDDGETWQGFDNYPDNFVLANYFTIGDSIVATLQSGIFSVKFDGSNYRIRALQNDGLESNEITSISEFQDSIYVSTYTGVFYKPKEKFFDEKVE